MRILADENIPAPLRRALAADGHDVAAIVDSEPMASDARVLRIAIAEDRVLLTFDADFGRMIYAEHHQPPRGVVFIRRPPPSLAETIARVRAVMNTEPPSIDGHFVAIDHQTRYHPLPNGTKGNSLDG